MYFEHIYDKTLSQASYFIGCQATGEAIVIDAKRDVDTYLTIAKQQKMQITHVVETHIHADFLAGTRELAALTGAKISLSAEGGDDWQYQYTHAGLREGDRLLVGNLSFEVIHTPGHTPESISLLLRDHPSSDEPVMIFTGDFVFVGDIGRPDLLEEAAGVVGSKDIGAADMFASLKKFSALPDYVQVWPGHGAGSACGKALGAVASSTVGYEKIRNWAFQYGDDYEGFKDALLSDQPEAPRYFATMKQLNRVERNLLTEVPVHPVKTWKEALALEGVQLVDARHKNQYAAGHIQGSLNIQHNNAMATWCGWMLSYSDAIVIIAEEAAHEEITRKLMRIGLDNISAFVTAIDSAPLVSSVVLDTEDVESLKDQDPYLLVDVRNRNEYEKSHIPGAVHAFVGHLPSADLRIFDGKKLIIQCQSGDRASIAYSYLESQGFKDLSIYPGSFAEWKKLGKPVAVEN